jgi:hypothetical protein
VIQHLLPQDSLLDGVDQCSHNDGEASCCCVVVRVWNPYDIAKEGVQWLEELPDRSLAAWHFTNLGIVEICRPRGGPIWVLCYKVLIHVDQVNDYHLPAASLVDWPQCHCFKWRLGFKDDWSRVPPCRDVHDWLGPHKRDMSSSGGLSGGGCNDGGSGGDARRGGTWVPQHKGFASSATRPHHRHR